MASRSSLCQQRAKRCWSTFSVRARTSNDGLYSSSVDVITREPPWGESETCLECATKFTITNRRHHWSVLPCPDLVAHLVGCSSRHCGRVLCKRCSMNELPILKFHLQKPVRVCQLCNDVLTLGVLAAR